MSKSKLQKIHTFDIKLLNDETINEITSYSEPLSEEYLVTKTISINLDHCLRPMHIQDLINHNSRMKNDEYLNINLDMFILDLKESIIQTIHKSERVSWCKYIIIKYQNNYTHCDHFSRKNLIKDPFRQDLFYGYPLFILKDFKSIPCKMTYEVESGKKPVVKIEGW